MLILTPLSKLKLEALRPSSNLPAEFWATISFKLLTEGLPDLMLMSQSWMALEIPGQLNRGGRIHLGFSIVGVVVLDGLATNNEDLPIFELAILHRLHQLDEAECCVLEVRGLSTWEETARCIVIRNPAAIE